MRRILFVILALFGSIVLLYAAKKEIKLDKKPDPIPKALVGRWVSDNLSGEALLFVVSEIECKLGKDGQYKGTVTFVDFQTASHKGKYTVDGDIISLYLKGRKNPYKLNYKISGDKKNLLTIKDEKYGITIALKLKHKKDDKDSSWF